MKVVAKVIVFLFVCAFLSVVSAPISAEPNTEIDSLYLQLSLTNNKDDSTKVQLLLKIAEKLIKAPQQIGDVRIYLQEALNIAIKIKSPVLISFTYDTYGVYYRDISQYDIALENHNKALDIAERLQNKQLLAKVYNNIGVVYRRMDEFSLAAFYHHKALNYAEEIGDQYAISVSLNSLGNIFNLNKNYDGALEMFIRALSLSKKENNQLGIAINLNNIGEVYEFKGDQKTARTYYFESLKINQSINSLKGLAICYNGVGNTYFNIGDNFTALDYYQKALSIDKLLSDKKFIANSYINIGKAKLALKYFDQAFLSLSEGLNVAKNIGAKWEMQQAYQYLSLLEEKRGNPVKALDYFHTAMIYKDSILNEKAQRSITLLQTLYKTDRAEKENQLLRKNQEIQEKEIRRQSVITVSLILGIIMAFLLIALIYNAFRIKRRAATKLQMQKQEIEEINMALSMQKEEILTQKEEIEKQGISIKQKNKYLEDAYRIIEDYINKITDSIKYAEQIQKAILPPIKVVRELFAKSFIFFKPKDIVSGDFYWFGRRDDKILFAAADCTGHGVPGAFMSIVGYDLINRAINENGIIKPSDILEFLNDQIRISLRKEEEDLVLKDGMDISFCCLDINTLELEYSGALCPLVYVRQGKIYEIKPDSCSIGISIKKLNRRFTNHVIQLQPEDTIYLFSDGFIDQFGGQNRKKFMRQNFINTLLDISHSDINEQSSLLEDIFHRWKGNNEQIDDILVVGIKI
jgi:Serine phosphatase RsbU, regulator of sigma subunit